MDGNIGSLLFQFAVVGIIALMFFLLTQSGSSKRGGNARRLVQGAFVVLAGLFSSNVVDPVEQAKVVKVRKETDDDPPNRDEASG